MQKFMFIVWLMSGSMQVLSQDSTAGKLDISGYAEAYYQYDFGRPANHERPGFIYNYKMHNQLNVNLAYLKAAYSSKKVRANIALMAGNYPEYNLAAEPGLMKRVLEMNVGYIMNDKWSMDIGILPSHIGIESAVSKDCWTLSRSLVAENSPYFETGIKLNHTPNERWSFSLFLLNGWQNIRETNKAKAWGTQVQFRPNKNWLVNSSSFLGNEQPDSLSSKTRFFHDLYITWQLSSKWSVAALFDIGIEKSDTWYGSALLMQYGIADKWKLGCRAEQYKDRQQVIIKTGQPVGAGLSGFSLNTDFIPSRHLVIRAEARSLHADRDVFLKRGNPSRNSFSLLGSVAVSF